MLVFLCGLYSCCPSSSFPRLPTDLPWVQSSFLSGECKVAGDGLHDDALLQYISNGSHAAPRDLVDRLARVLGDEHLKMVNLTSDWLNSFLPHAISKVNRVHYGLLTPRDVTDALRRDPTMPLSRRLLAVPFLGKDVPSLASEFAHPDVIIGLTILAYR